MPLSATPTGSAALVGLVGANQGRRFPLSSGRLLLGRDASQCQLVLEHAVVSRVHAVLQVTDQGDVIVEDQQSTQGTFVNEVRITRQQLTHGDIVGFGRNGMLAFRFESLAGTTTPSLEPEVVQTRSGAQDPLGIGRAPDNDIVLPSPAVSRYHARVIYPAGRPPVIEDLGSTNGTFVNGATAAGGKEVQPADLVFLGGFVLRIDGRRVQQYDLAASRLLASNVSQVIGTRRIINDVSLAIQPREFVALMGPSGCGKTTLMDAMNGLRPAREGTVLINDLDLYRNFEALRRSIGYVPQRDVLHDALSVERTLYYAVRLRLPRETPGSELDRLVAEVIETVGLTEQRQTAFQSLSGGQQKRLSLALELLTKPSFLFLDEPTSPLDPDTSSHLMLLFRRLADEGRIVVMVTHKFEEFDQLHQVAFLSKTGELAFFGPPVEALRYFDCREPGEIYRKIADRGSDAARIFRQSPQYSQFVGARVANSQAVRAVAADFPASGPAATRKRVDLQQTAILAKRYLEIKLADRRNTAVLLLQAPVIAVILAMIAGDTMSDIKTLFIGAIIAVWFGANNAIREIVAELPIYRRERLVHLTIPAYLGSKVAVLGGIAIAQCTLFLVTLLAMDRLPAGDFAPLLITLTLTAWGGTTGGLLCSALVNSTEKAMSVLPLILIPQLLLSGFMMPVDDFHVSIPEGRRVSRPADGTPRPDIQHVKGMGSLGYVSSAMSARWALDALAHTASASDAEARDRLATQISLDAYQHVLDGVPSDEVERAFKTRVLTDWCWLFTIGAVWLFLSGGAMRMKDNL